MSETTTKPAGGQYGYETDEVKTSPMSFGLNANAAFLTKFEWIPNGGKGGAEAEALEIIFNINGTDKSARMFPVTKAFDKDNNEVTDPSAPEMIEAFKDFNAKVTHILHVFQSLDVIQVTMSRPVTSFKDFAQLAMSVLPKDFASIPLDIFAQYQWQPSTGKDRTYLDIPGKMKYGRWLTKATPGVTWEEVRDPNPTESTREALFYVNKDDTTVKHVFVRNGWFMLSKFANQVKPEASDNTASSASSTAMNASSGAQAGTGGAKATW